MNKIFRIAARSSGFLIGVPFFYPHHIDNKDIHYTVAEYPNPVWKDGQARPAAPEGTESTEKPAA